MCSRASLLPFRVVNHGGLTLYSAGPLSSYDSTKDTASTALGTVAAPSARLNPPSDERALPYIVLRRAMEEEEEEDDDDDDEEQDDEDEGGARRRTTRATRPRRRLRPRRAPAPAPAPAPARSVVAAVARGVVAERSGGGSAAAGW